MITALTLTALAWADPCGMVPPIYTGPGPEPVGVARTGLQQTYVFFRDGVQTIAIRPGFKGSVEEFGMLVPLPAVPALRKIDDRTFEHLRSAVDPPVVNVQIIRQPMPPPGMMARKSAVAESSAPMELFDDEVRVVKEEAVGMYEVAVLEAGSARALDRWMSDHDFRYPEGMDGTVEDYVEAGWLFVAIKTKVGAMGGVAPHPGQRAVETGLPSGSSFDGYVQGMAFRFEVDEPVVPMRLAVFNGDDTHNRVYALAEEPVRFDEITSGFVRRQVSGRSLRDNLIEPLPLVVSGGSIRSNEQDRVSQARVPDPYVAAARDLMAADLMAVATGELSLPFEEQEKELLRISEALSLRGAEIDGLHNAEIAEVRTEAVRPALQDLYEMTLTVVDGNFPSEVLANRNLHLASFDMKAAQNRTEVWNDRVPGPTVYLYR